MGAEYCPYCAAERWAMIVALSRFGTFSGLSTVHSASTRPATPSPSPTRRPGRSTLHVHQQVPDVHPGRDADQHPGPFDRHLHHPADAHQGPAGAAHQVRRRAPRAGAIPFIDFGNKYLIAGASYNPQVLAGLCWSTIASDLSNPNSAVAKAVDGTANYITAAICQLTGNQPASACTATVKSLESQI